MAQTVKHLPTIRETWVRKIWRRKWQPTPVFLPGKSHEQRSLVGYSPWDRRVEHDWMTSLSLYLCLVKFKFKCKIMFPNSANAWWPICELPNHGYSPEIYFLLKLSQTSGSDEWAKGLELALELWGDNLDRKFSDSPVMEAV